MSTYNVSTEQQLNQVLDEIDKGTGSQTETINLTANIGLTTDLSVVGATGGNITINGEGHTINGNGDFSGLMVLDADVQINNLTITDAKAVGGAGGNGYGGGGGGAGLGGALFVGAQASVVVNNSYFTNNSAVGAKGGTGGTDATANFGNSGIGGGGGGGLGGAGGAGGYQGSGGGGGGIGVLAYGQTSVRAVGYVEQVAFVQGMGIVFLPLPYSKTVYGLGSGPGKGIAYGSAGGGNGQGYTLHSYISVFGHYIEFSTVTENGGTGATNGGGGGAGYGGAGGGGGIGGYSRQQRSFHQTATGGSSNGGFGGGGGGSFGLSERGGNGGFGGGGGGEASGNGGFGGGGGGGVDSGLGGWGAGNGGAKTTVTINKTGYLSQQSYFGGGGGGLGAGGGIFVESGGTLAFDSGTISGNSVAGGAGGGFGATAGDAYGSGIFGMSGTISFDPGAGQTVTVADNISDEQTTAGSYHLSLQIGGGSSGGTVTLQGSDDYTGSTDVVGGDELVLAETGASRIGDVQLSGTIVRNGSNAVTIGGMSGRTGSLVIESGTLAIGAPINSIYNYGVSDIIGTLSGTGGVLQIGIGQGLEVLESGVTTLASQLSGAGALAMGGSGTLVLTGGAAGITLDVDSTIELDPTSSVQSFGVVSDYYGSLLLEGSANINIGTLLGLSGTLTQLGTETVNISGGNFTGHTTITHGTLNLIGDVSQWAGPIVDNSVLEFAETGSSTGYDIYGRPYTIAAETSTFNGLVAGDGDIIVTGGGELVFAAVGEIFAPALTVTDDSTVVLAATDTIESVLSIASGALAIVANTHSTTTLLGTVTGPGTLELASGDLRLGSSAAFSSNGVLLIQGGTLDLNGDAPAVGELIGSGGTINLDGGTLTVQHIVRGFSASIEGSGALKIGAGGLFDNTGTSNNLVFGSSSTFVNYAATYTYSRTYPFTVKAPVVETESMYGLVQGSFTAGADFSALNEGTIDARISLESGTITNADGTFDSNSYPNSPVYYAHPIPLITGGISASGALDLTNAGAIENGVTLGSGTIVNASENQRYRFIGAEEFVYEPAVISGGIIAASGLTLTNGAANRPAPGFSEIFGGITAGAHSTITNENNLYEQNGVETVFADTIVGNIVLSGGSEFLSNGGIIENGVTLLGGGTIVNQGYSRENQVAYINYASISGPGLLKNQGTIGSASVTGGATLVNDYNVINARYDDRYDISSVYIGSGSTIENTGRLGKVVDAGYIHEGYGSIGTLAIVDHGTFVNSGYFAPKNDFKLDSGGLLINQSAGFLGNKESQGDLSFAGTIENYGQIAISPDVGPGGLLVNEATGLIQGYEIQGFPPLYLSLDDDGATIVNEGIINAALGIGGLLSNTSGGTITSTENIYVDGQLLNAGAITGSINLEGGAVLDNYASGTIDGSVALIGGETLINAGTIEGQVDGDGTTAGRLVLAPTSLIEHGIYGNLSIELEAGTGAISGAIDASYVYLDSGAHWSAPSSTPPSGQTQTFAGTGTLSVGVVEVVNALTNEATFIGGITLSPGTTFDNTATGVVLGSVLDEGGSVDNFGSISGQVRVYAGATNGTSGAAQVPGSLTNEASGTIGSVYLGAGGAFVDHGTVGNITLSSQASFVNQGTITGVISGAGGTLINQGIVLGGLAGSFDSIDNAGHLGGTLNLDETFTNESGGTITGVIINSRYADIVNHGLISGSIANEGGQNVSDTLMNYGSITGGVVEGSYAGSYSTRVVNAGTLGLSLVVSMGHMTNTSTGVIDGGVDLVLSTEYNYGVISGGDTLNTGIIVNESAGQINGGLIEQGTEATVFNYGTISGGLTLNGQSDRLVLAPTGVTQGPIIGASNFSDTLELTSGSGIGTLSGVSNFGTIIFDPGADWVLGGSNTLVNDSTHGAGTEIIGAGSLTVVGTLVNYQSLGLTIDLASTGTLINEHTGYIGGTLADTGAVINAGTINALSPLGNGVNLINRSGGAIEHAVTATGTGDIVSNAGTIVGGLTLAGNYETLALYVGASPGAVSVLGGGAALELHMGQGTLTNAGVNLADFESIVVDSGADWSFDGDYAFDRAVTLGGSGTLAVQETVVYHHVYGPGVTYSTTAVLAGTLTNTSTLTDTAVLAGGTVINETGGVFDGLVGQNLTILNYGQIGSAVTVTGGLLTNEAVGTFAGAIGGGTLDDTGVLDNASISHATLILRDGYSVTGMVQGGPGSVLDYEGTGTLSGIGNTFVGFQTIKTNGATSLAADTTIAARSTLVVYGTLTAPGAPTIDGSFVNHGTLVGDVTIASGASGYNADATGSLIPGTIAPAGDITGTLVDESTFVNDGELNGVVLSGTGAALINLNAIYSAVVATGSDETVATGQFATGGITLQGLADTLTLSGGFFSQAIATPGNGDVLLLEGSGTLFGVESPFTLSPGETVSISGFDAIDFAPGADWTLGGATTLTTSLPLATGGTSGLLTVSGNLSNDTLQGFGVIQTAGTLFNSAGGDFTAPVVDFADVYNASGGTLTSLILSGGATVHATNFGTILNGVTLTGSGERIGLGGEVSGGVLALGSTDYVNVLGTVSGGMVATASGGFFTIEQGGLLAGGMTASGGGGQFVDLGTIANGATLEGTGNTLWIGAPPNLYGEGGTVSGAILVAGSSNAVVLGGGPYGEIAGDVTVTGSGDVVSVASPSLSIIGPTITGAVHLVSTSETLFDGGTIAGGVTVTGAGDRVVLATSAAATRIVTDADGSSIIELQAGSGTLTLGTSGAVLDGPGTIEIDAGADWTLAGTLATGVSLLIEGSGTIDASHLVLSGTLSDTGTLAGALTIGNGGTFVDTPETDVTGTVAGTSGGTLELIGSRGTLAGLGQTVVGIPTISVTSGANWTLSNGATIVHGTVFDVAGSLSAGGAAVDLGSIDNAGYVAGPFTIGATGTLRNESGALIGGAVGVVLSGGLLDNLGAIDASSTGLTWIGGTLENSGTIAGGTYGLVIANGGSFYLTGGAGSPDTAVAVSTTQDVTLELAGTVSGATAVQIGGGADRLILDAGAAYQGALTGTGVSTLEFVSGTQRTINVIQDSFGTIDVDSGAALRLDEIATISNGVLFQNAGSISVLGQREVVNYYVASGMPPMSGTLNAPASLVDAGSLVNSGIIDADNQFSGIGLEGGGTLVNLSGALISGFGDGVGVLGAGMIENAGTIIGASDGTVKIDGTLHSNYPAIGVYGADGASVTLDNFGTIIGAGNTAVYLHGVNDVVTVEQGGAFLNGSGGVGLVIGGEAIGFGGGNDTLNLASGIGTIDGSDFTYFDQLTIAAGGDWTLTGHTDLRENVAYNGIAEVDGTLVNSGTLYTGTLYDAGTLINEGSLYFHSITLTGALTNVSGGTIQGTLDISSGSDFVNESGGTIIGNVTLGDDTSFTLQSGSVLDGTIIAGNGVTLAVDGTITGPYYIYPDIELTGTGDTLIVGPDASFNDYSSSPGFGTVSGGAGNTLELGPGTDLGTFKGLGYFNGFTATTIAEGADWINGLGYRTLATGSRLVNDGTFTVNGYNYAQFYDKGVLVNSGTIINDSFDGLIVGTGGQFFNFGTLVTTQQSAVTMDGGLLTNDGLIENTAGIFGINAEVTPGTFYNFGTIDAQVAFGGGYGATLVNYGTVIGNVSGDMVVEAGSTLDGTASGTIDFAAGATFGPSNETQYTGSVTLASRSDLIVGATNTINATLSLVPLMAGPYSVPQSLGISLDAGQSLTVDIHGSIDYVVAHSATVFNDYGQIRSIDLYDGNNRITLASGVGTIQGAGATDSLYVTRGANQTDLYGFGTVKLGFDAFESLYDFTLGSGTRLTDLGDINVEGTLGVEGTLIVGGMSSNGLAQLDGGTIAGDVTLGYKADVFNTTIDGVLTGVGAYANIASSTSIYGSNGVAVDLTGTNVALQIAPSGQTISGSVTVGGGTIDLTAQTGTAYFTGLGSQFQGFDTLDVYPGNHYGSSQGQWDLTGSNTFGPGGLIGGGGTLDNLGTLTMSGGTIGYAAGYSVGGGIIAVTFVNTGTLIASGPDRLLINTGLEGYDGTVEIGSGSTLEVGGYVGLQTIVMDPGSYLQIDQAQSFFGVVSGFGAGDTLRIEGAQFAANGHLPSVYGFDAVVSGGTIIDAAMIENGLTIDNGRLILDTGYAAAYYTNLVGIDGTPLELEGSGSFTGLEASSGLNRIDGFSTVQTDGTWSLTGSNTLISATTFTGAGTLFVTDTLNVAGTLFEQGTLNVAGTLNDAGFVENSGAITGNGIVLNGGSLFNESMGTIAGTRYGVTLSGASGTATDAGTITGGTAAVYIGDGDRLILLPGAVLSGGIAGTAGSILELGSGTSAGTLTSLGSGAALTTVDAGAKWVLTGTNTLTSAQTLDGPGTLDQGGTLYATGTIDPGLLINDGTIDVVGSLVLSGAVTDDPGVKGVINVGSGTLEVVGSISRGETIILGTDATLIVDDAADFNATIEGFRAGSVIDLTAVAGGASAGLIPQAGGALTVSGTSGGAATLNFLNNLSTQAYTLSDDPGDGTMLSADQVLAGGTLTAASQTIASGQILLGFGTIAGSVDNEGLIAAQGGTLEVVGSIAGSGSLDIGRQGTLVLDQPTSEAVYFEPVANGESLVLGAGGFAGTISGFALGDSVELTGAAFSSNYQLSVANGLLQLSEGGSSYDLQFDSSQGLTAANFSIAAGSGGDTVIGFAIGNGQGLFVSAGRKTTGASVASGAFLVVDAGGIADDTVVASGGYIFVAGSASATTVQSGGVEVVSSGGMVSATSLSGAVEVVSSGGSAVGTLLSSGGDFVAGTIVSATLADGSFLLVSAGGTASATMVEAGTQQLVLGTASATQLSVGGIEYVSSGGRSVSATVLGGIEVVVSGGLASGTLVSGGGAFVYGSATGMIVGSGAFAVVEAGGIASATTVSRGGLLLVSGAASATTVSGGVATVLAGGSDTGTLVAVGADVVSSGGLATGLMIASGAGAFDYGSTTSAMVSGGAFIVVETTGSARATALTGGNLFVDGTASGTVVSAGVETVSSGGTDVGATVSGGAFVVSSGGTSENMRIDAGAGAFDYGNTTSATIAAGAFMVIETAASASATMLTGGNLIVDGTASGTVLSAGVETVSSGGTDVGATLSGGALVVSSGGTSENMTVDAGAGAFVYGSATGATVASGGFVLELSGGTASATTVASGGSLQIEGTDSGTIVQADGREVISSGGIDSGTTLSGGIEVISSGGTISGTVTFASSGEIVINQPSNFGAGALVAGFSTPSDILDFRNISYAAGPTIGFTEAGNNLSGTLTVAAGGITDTLTLIGQYSTANFVSGSDAFGGATVIDPPVMTSAAISQPVHA